MENTNLKISAAQKRIYELLKDREAEIQVNNEVTGMECALVFENGSCETVNKRTFKKLAAAGLIRLSYRPAMDVERWAAS